MSVEVLELLQRVWDWHLYDGEEQQIKNKQHQRNIELFYQIIIIFVDHLQSAKRDVYHPFKIVVEIKWKQKTWKPQTTKKNRNIFK